VRQEEDDVERFPASQVPRNISQVELYACQGASTFVVCFVVVTESEISQRREEIALESRHHRIESMYQEKLWKFTGF